MTSSIQFGSKQIVFQLEYSNRKSLGITVKPDLSVLVKAPVETSLEKVKEKHVTLDQFRVAGDKIVQLFNKQTSEIKEKLEERLKEKQQHLKNIAKETPIKAIKARINRFFVNSFPSTGEIVSIFTISNLYGKLPVIRIVCNFFILFKASL